MSKHNKMQDAFTAGYICAVATVLRTHGADRIARDVLGCIGPVTKENTNSYDYEILKKYDLVELEPVREAAPPLLDKCQENDKIPG